MSHQADDGRSGIRRTALGPNHTCSLGVSGETPRRRFEAWSRNSPVTRATQRREGPSHDFGRYRFWRA